MGGVIGEECATQNAYNTKLGIEIGTPKTIGEAMNRQIQYARQSLEKLCIAKAKAETLNLLDLPYQDMRQILGHIL